MRHRPAKYEPFYEGVIQHSQRTGRTDYVVCTACGSGVLDKKAHNRFHEFLATLVSNAAEEAGAEQGRKIQTWINYAVTPIEEPPPESVGKPQWVRPGGHTRDYVRSLENEYARALERLRKYSGNLLERYRIQAELEDLEDGHWDGPRTDLTEVPEGWA